MTACLGSVGAARVMRAACSRARGQRRWTVAGTNRLGLDAGYDGPRWGVMVGCPGQWVDIDRATARLLLRGLLAEGVARELVAELRRRRQAADEGSCGCGEYSDGVVSGYDIALELLEEMGVTR